MFILDLLVAILLVITIAFAFVLNKRLGKLRGDRKAFEKLAGTFGDATSRAEKGINALHKTTDVLQERLDKALALKDDLAFMIERGDKTADKLERLLHATREIAVVVPDENFSQDTKVESQSSLVPEVEENLLMDTRDEAQPVTEPDNKGVGKSEAERELLKAIRSSG